MDRQTDSIAVATMCQPCYTGDNRIVHTVTYNSLLQQLLTGTNL